MKKNRTELEMSSEGKGLELSDELLGSVYGGGMHQHKKKHKPKPDWSEVDPEDGSTGITYTW